ncbi:MAG: TatD family hydrolase, partial [Pseudomonadota bacterium]|nr:TatD family hydrolase [Pseudomonadota bacterium]
VLQRARAVGISGLLVAGVEPKGWAHQRALASQFDGVHWTAGLHPVYVAGCTAQQLNLDIEHLRDTLTMAPGPCGLGEMGLDRRFASPESLPRQIEAFRTQLSLAREIDRPVVLHVVAAHGQVLQILRADGVPPSGGVVHSFSGAAGLAEQYLALGLHLGLSTAICRGRNKKIDGSIRRIPWNRIMVETDAPDQGVVPGSRNEPSELVRVATYIAQIRGCTSHEVLAASTTNFLTLFGVAKNGPVKE